MCTNRIVAILSCLCLAGLVHAQDIEFPPSPTTLEAYDAPGYFLVATTSGGAVQMVEGGDTTDAGQWNLIDGLAPGDGQRVTFESIFVEGAIMRHRSYVFYTDARATDNLFLNDSTFVMVPGLADPTAVSFQSVNYTDRYLMHNASFGLVLQAPSDPATATFKFPRLNVGSASDPVPADEASDVRPDIVLSWTPGDGAASHDVYLGEAFDDVNTATPSSDVFLGNQFAAEYNPAALGLDWGQTYYWRVDEVNTLDPNSPYKGDIWSFTLEPYTYAVEDINVVTNRAINAGSEPEKMVDGSGVLAGGGHSNDDDDMWQAGGALTDPVVIDFTLDRVYKLDEIWVWNFNHEFEMWLNFGLKDITIEYATEPNEWTALGDVVLTQGTGNEMTPPQAIDFGGAAAKYIRFTATSSYGGQGVGLAEVQFRYIPTFAREPEPEAGADGVLPDVTLSWRPGREAVSHRIHLGTDPNVVAAGQSLAGISSVPSYSGTLLNLQLDQKYYWMITEVNTATTPSSWDSEVWDFNTPSYIVVDDMESYDDEDNLIFASWVDGLDDTSNGGSQVGMDDPPYASLDVVHSGSQAMLFQFGKGGLTTSEADLTLPSPQNWKNAGITTLVIWFRGQVGNATPQLYAKINNTTINYTGSTASLAAPVWKQWNINLASVGAASNVTSLSLGVSGAGQGTVYFDDIRLYKDAAPQTGNAVNPGTSGLKAYYPMNDSVADASGSGYNGTAETGSSFGAGPTNYGRALVLDGDGGHVTLPIGPLVQSLSDTTIGAWVKWEGSGSQWCRIFDFGTGTATNMFLTPNSGSSTLRFAIATDSAGGGAGESIVERPGILSAGWHHVAITMEAATMTMALYVDGEMVASAPTDYLPRDLGNTNLNYLGNSQWDDPYLPGSIDEFCIYNRALSAEEIQYLAGDR